MTNRELKDFGISPVIGYLLLLAGFIGLSLFLFYKTAFAEYIYISVALAFVSRLSEIKRNDFLKGCFSAKNFNLLRITENLIVTLPFILFLFFKQLLLSPVILLCIAVLLGLTSFKTTLNFTIPTPFSRRPFEFSVGFRNTFYLFIISCLLTCIALFYDNFNLGVFALLLVIATPFSYYFKLENDYFIWIFNGSPKQFLFQKIKTGILFSSMLSLPIALILGFSYPANVEVVLLSIFLGYCFLITVIMAKYASYPYELGLPEVIIIIVSVFFPPLLLAIIPYFFIKSTKRLTVLLG